jgi:NAD(P)-dependent dehydrogenase (short-subunit alcohol dehydrogenase family)
MPEPVFAHTEATEREIKQVTWDFSGDVVLITGAAHGQARTHARAFARAGADLALCDIGENIDTIYYPMGTSSELEETAEKCREQGVNVVTRVCDVRDDRQVSGFIDDAVKELGKVDVAIASAGVAAIVEVTDMTEQEWDVLLDTNLKGVFLTFKYAARKMIEQGGGGRLIATGSVHCFTGVPGSAHYVAAKHGVAGLCKSLAIELAPHKIRVNYVCPTAANTHMVEALTDPRVPEDHGERLFATTGSWNLLDEGSPPIEPIEISQAMLWLASDASLKVTGAAVPVDAGFLTK